MKTQHLPQIGLWESTADSHGSPLVAISSFQESSPINLRWAIQLHYDELVHSGVLFRFGRKLLIDPEQFWVWLRESGHQAALR
jgi:hypothetical protein